MIRYENGIRDEWPTTRFRFAHGVKSSIAPAGQMFAVQLFETPSRKIETAAAPLRAAASSSSGTRQVRLHNFGRLCSGSRISEAGELRSYSPFPSGSQSDELRTQTNRWTAL